jgi:hypothetical protein
MRSMGKGTSSLRVVCHEAGVVWVSLTVDTYLFKREFLPVCRLAAPKNDP